MLGYPILSIRSIPKQREYLDRYYQDELTRGVIRSPLELNHVWPENYSANSAQKVWAAAFAAHHPNVVVLDLSSFKCGHDAPTYGLIDSIIETSKTPYAALHDIDANKPGGSIKIRVKTYAHALKLHEERLQDAAKRKSELRYALDKKREELLSLKLEQLAARRQADPKLAEELAELQARLRAYEAPKRTEAPELPKGMVLLGKKTEHGIVCISAEAHARRAENPAAREAASPSLFDDLLTVSAEGSRANPFTNSLAALESPAGGEPTEATAAE